MTIEQVTDRIVELIEHKRFNHDFIVLTGGEPMRQQIIPLLKRLSDFGFTTQIETAGTVWPEPAMVMPVSPSGVPEAGAPHLERLEQLIKGGDVEIVCSPKTPGIHPKIEEHCQHYKYIIRKFETDEADGLPVYSTQIEGQSARLYRPDAENVIPTIWLQPMAEYFEDLLAPLNGPDDGGTKENIDECVRLAIKHGYRLSLQQHKILGIE